MTEWWEKYVGLIPSAGIYYPQEDWTDLVSSNNNKLHTYRFPCKNPRAIVVLFHGFNTYANTLAHLARRFSEDGFLAVSLDFENHGKSGRSTFSDMRTYFADACRYIQQVKVLHPDLPLFLLGESMGATVAVHVALQGVEVAGLILLAPAFGTPGVAARCVPYVLRLAAWLVPHWTLGTINPEDLSSNQYVKHAVAEDPLFGKEPVTFSTAWALISGMRLIKDQAALVQAPLMIVQGGNDRVTCASSALQFYREAASSEKKLVYRQDMHHGVSAEAAVWEVLEEMIDWANKRLIK